MRRSVFGLSGVFVLALVAGCGGGSHHGSSASATPRYRLTDLGTLGGTYSDPKGLSPDGKVVGSSAIAEGNAQHAFLYVDGAMRDLTSLAGFGASAMGVNANGEVVGAIASADGVHAALYANGVVQDLGTIKGGTSLAYAINASGQIVGEANNASDLHAFLYSAGVMQDLGTEGRTSSARGINESGQVVGEAEFGAFDHHASHAFLYSNGAMQDLGTLGGAISSARGLNASGQVVGYSWIVGDAVTHAFLYSGSVITDLGTLGGPLSLANAINASGQIVGGSKTADDYHGFLFAKGKMTDLNDLLDSAGAVWTVREASGITDSGTIVAIGTAPGSTQAHAVLLTPVE